jgi:hypothetical protein
MRSSNSRDVSRGWRTVASASVLAAVAAAGPASAGPASGPTMVAITSVAGSRAPLTLEDGTWSQTQGVWQLGVRSASLPAGQTIIRGSWRSPTFQIRPRQVYFSSSFEGTHQGQSDSSSGYFEEARVCFVRGGCERQWFSEEADATPQQYDAGVLPFTVSFGHGMGFTNGSKAVGRAWIEWRYTLKQSSVDEQTVTIRVAVGTAASHV